LAEHGLSPYAIMLDMNTADYVLTEHAELEMSRRQIEPEWVAMTMAAPEQIVEGFNGRKVFQSRIESSGKTHLVRLVVEEWHLPPVVVTIYRTSKIEKYWRME